MKLIVCSIVGLGSLCASIATAQTSNQFDNALQLPPPPPLNRIGLSYRMGFNVGVDFNHLGGYSSTSSLRTPDGAVYNFDTGYIYPDATTANAHPGYTWNYGYVAGSPMSAGQFDLYRSTAPNTLDSKDNYGDPQHGLELTYNRQLGEWHRLRYGLEAGFNFTDFTVQDSRTLMGSVVRNTQGFATGGGAVLNPAPFQGTFEGPSAGGPGWPLVALGPASSADQTFVGGATITGNRQIQASFLGLRLGPYLEYPLSKRWTASLSAGLSVLYVHSRFQFDQTVSLDPAITLVTLPPAHSSGSSSTDEFLVGGYVEGTIGYSLTEHWRLLAGAQFQGTGDFAQFQMNKESVLKLGTAVYAIFGISYSF
jgi:hypothetical protein